jgi:hypothetical protein
MKTSSISCLIFLTEVVFSLRYPAIRSSLSSDQQIRQITTITTRYLSSQTLENEYINLFPNNTTAQNDSISPNTDPVSQIQSTTSPKRIPIGSQPEFSIPDDSTIETPMQRGFLWVHFSLLFYNLFLVGTSLNFSTILPLELIKYVWLVLFSVVLGDFAVRYIILPCMLTLYMQQLIVHTLLSYVIHVIHTSCCYFINCTNNLCKFYHR